MQFLSATGLDVLEVVAGLDVFAACFAYSAATHAFVQRPVAAPPGAAYLSVLTTAAFAGVLRSHGLGLLPAAVNAAYQLLARRTHTLSQVSWNSLVHCPLNAWSPAWSIAPVSQGASGRCWQGSDCAS